MAVLQAVVRFSLPGLTLRAALWSWPLLLMQAVDAQTWRPAMPSPRYGNELAYDSARGRTVLFGGVEWVSGSPADTWEFDGSRWTPVATAAAPPPRSMHAMAYDAARGKVVLFSGYDPNAATTPLVDTWTYDGITWNQVMTANTPAERNLAALVYDAARGRLVLFGGRNSSASFGDTWEFDGANWTAVSAIGPATRFGHGLAYDSGRGRTVLFGGQLASNNPLLFGDTWEFDGTNWTQITTGTAPSARFVSAMTYDSVRGRIVLGVPFTDTWTFDGTAWTQLAAAPVAGTGSGAAAFDSGRDRIVLFEALGETWEFDGANWNKAIGHISPRSNHAMSYDNGRARFVLFGGTNGIGLGDTWEFDGSRWTQAMTVNAPPARAWHDQAYDSARARTVLFGGWNTVTTIGDTWEFDGNDWTGVITAVAPPPRYGHALAYDSRRRRTVLFAGAGLSDTWEFDGANWQQVTTAAAPLPRREHGLAYDTARARMVMHGGLDAAHAILDDTWEYDGAAWSPVTSSMNRPQMVNVGLAYDAVRGRTVAMGASWTSMSFDVWEFDGTSWSWMMTASRPWSRYGFAFVYDPARGHPVLFGGAFLGSHGASYATADTWELLPPTMPTWARHGSGCAGSAGTPSFDVVGNAVPALGTILPLRFTGLPAMPGIIFVASGFGIARWQGVPLPIELGPPGCMLWIEPEPGAFAMVTHGGVSASHQLAIPANVALAGLRVAMQALVFDASSPNGVGTVTNAGVALLY